MDNNKELITVVVPVYNVETYIQHCAESISNQTYTNLEIYLVDDGSSDLSGTICDELAKKDNRFKVIHKANGGLSDARNVALDQAKGKYITFVDSDDYMPYDAIEYMYELIKRYNADISIGSMYLTSKVDDKIENQETQHIVLNNKEAVTEMLYGSYYTASASGKLYKTSLFQNIRYPFGKLNEDLFTTYKILDKSTKTVCTDKIVYYYFHRSGSIMNSSFNERRLDVLLALDQIETDINLKDYGAETAYAGLTLSTTVALLALKPEKQLVDDYRIWDRVKENRNAVFKDKRCNKTIKAYALLSFGGVKVLTQIYNVYYKLKWR